MYLIGLLFLSLNSGQCPVEMASRLFKLLEAGLSCDVADRCAEHAEKQTQAETQNCKVNTIYRHTNQSFKKHQMYCKLCICSKVKNDTDQFSSTFSRLVALTLIAFL